MKLQDHTSGIFQIEGLGPGVCAGFSSRAFDNSRRSDFLRGLALCPERLVMVKQVHGREVAVVDRPDLGWIDKPADGLITQIPGLVLGVRTADCIPIFFWDPNLCVIGIAHGGWRGVKEGIVGQMLGVFERKFKTRKKDLVVALGPSIQKCCYEVGKEFADYFPGFYREKDEQKGYLDLSGVVCDQLTKGGVLEANIHRTDFCTVCRNDTFFSYRVERQTQERILSVISIVKD